MPTFDDEPTIRIEPAPPERPEHQQGSLTALLRDLADDGRALIQQEISLAKLEVVTSVVSFGKNGALIAAGLLLLALGGLVLIAFLVLGLGRLLGNQYWLSSLIVGGVLALVGAALLLGGRRGLQRGEIAPRRTLQSVRDNKDWAEEEIRQIGRDLAQ